VRPRAGLDGRKISSPPGFDPEPSPRLVLYLYKQRNTFYQATKVDMFLCNSHRFDVTLFHLTLSFEKGNAVDKTNVQVELSTFCVNARCCACEVMQRTAHLGRVLMH